ncbi:MAG: secondary thiamine-phosphate synthase enzyme YjbQ [Candidatus Neomarinimicrobiota bacterium]|jgi:secondary thiamine-phosphate synthase enzyme|nr:secondary thiamine-phosphate synthase enzyme YjbQ [Candidatus Neomarinimicrobiota bacterium]MDD3966511.1 secondary thiamine-phosphate synthase enzyme YjbQ [Candidatus Neomarinimicrobiota bacterium]MDX9780739.1 secondary thiamine-phosphate synthase enzyme YjbQ [bacterium]
MKRLTFSVNTGKRTAFIDIGSIVEEALRQSSCDSGIVCIFTPHTTAALTINENADPDVLHDLDWKINSLIPNRERQYKHCEGNSDSHLKSSLFSPSLTLIFENKKCLLGTWQGIYLCEFDGPRTRKIHIKIIEDHSDQEHAHENP